jgi:isopentenyl diphosphate isomerase/L-lactate dehydrogenase-like FMN-dependent dehydrogenase
MDRRTFTQLFTLAAGSLGLMQAAGQAQENDADTQTDADAAENGPPSGPSSKAVNVEDLRQLAEAALPKASFDYIATGSADEITLRENIAAFQRLRVFPPLMKGVSEADLSTTALGQKIELPVLLAPVAAQRMYHPQGGLAAARAAAVAGTIYGVSSSVGNSVEEIAAAGKGPKWYQLYVPKDRAVARNLVRRVERAGYKAIIVTVDLGEWKDADRRNRFSLPKEMLVKHLRDVGFEQITDKMSYQAISEFNADAWDLSLSWEFFDWLRGVTKLPILIKGVLRAEDAKKAVSIGLDGIVVSNHGGRRLDGMPATIDVLPSIAEAVDGKAEIYMDGGVRRGTDVLKALAFGARAVLIGRPYAWALAADGEAGVARVIELFREELINAMIATGCSKLGDIERSLIA